jgi:hypothetical protein
MPSLVPAKLASIASIASITSVAVGALAALVMLGLSACSEDAPAQTPPPACADVAPEKASASCTPLYEPSYENVFAKTLMPTCAKSGVSCHASTGRQGGLAFEDADESYRLLLESTQAVRAGDPACSPIVARLVATDGNVRMPPGRSLDAKEQCSVIQWIAKGAKR